MFRWEAYRDGVQVDRSELATAFLDETFSTQAEAEQWLGRYYDAFSDLPATQVALYEDEQLILGPMNLEG